MKRSIMLAHVITNGPNERQQKTTLQSRKPRTVRLVTAEERLRNAVKRRLQMEKIIVS